MQDTFLQDIRQRLQTEQVALQTELGKLRSQAAPDDTQSEHAGLGNHMADDASDVFEQEKTLALFHHTEKLLDKVDTALHKLEKGNYGLCESCGQRIDTARLESLPYASLCMTCKSRQEKR